MEAMEEDKGNAIEIIPIHFDVDAHYVPLHTFVKTAENVEEIIESFNQRLFDGKLQYDLFVLPPEEGTFLSRLGFAIIAGWGMVWSFSESDIGKAFIKGLTTHEPAHWAEMAGAHIRQSLAELGEEADVDHSADEQAVKRKCEAVIIAEAAKSFLQKDASELQAVGVDPLRFRDAYGARNKFYRACWEAPDLRGIGFEEAPVFPIPRRDFARLLVALPPDEDDEQEPWITGTAVLKVTSPNWDRDDKQRQWKGKDRHGRERYFKIEDEYFWSLVRAGELSTHIIDTMKVQWAFRGKDESPKQARVLKVLEFNGVVLSEPFDESALNAILGLYRYASSAQPDLFDQT
jgi:hypothetical protein